MKQHLSRLLALLSAFACVALVGTIETLNIQTGDAIGKKRMHEPQSKWRITSPRTECSLVEREYRDERGIPAHQTLNPTDVETVEARFKQRWDKELPRYRLGLAMRDFSVWGIPLGVVTGFFSLIARRNAGHPPWAPLLTTSGVVGGLTFLISAFRYFPALGL